MRGDSAQWEGGRRPAPQPRALVVEDEPPLARLLVGYLQREGFQTTACEDGERAVQLAGAHDPEVIVLDLMLPGWTASRRAGGSAASATPTSSCSPPAPRRPTRSWACRPAPTTTSPSRSRPAS